MLSGRMKSLQDAMNKYGAESIRNYKLIHPLGDKIVANFKSYLGEGAEVLGAPPFGDWRPDDYHDAKFSTYWNGTLTVAPISMGLALRIPYVKDSGELWIRLVVDISIQGSEFNIFVGDEPKSIIIPQEYEESHLEQVYEALVNYVVNFFEDPVKAATSASTGKIGFITHNQ